MSLKSNKYKDTDREHWQDISRGQKTRYRQRTGAYAYPRRSYTTYEDELILESDLSDRELSEQLQRSVNAIQHRRHRLLKEDDNE